MGIYDDVNAGMKEAMKAKDKARLTALRNIRAAFIEALKLDNAETLSDDACLGILRKLAKTRADSIQAYREGGRDDLADEEAAELAVIEGFLPALADEAQTRAWAAAAIAEVGASSPKDMGKVMGALTAAHGAALDGKLAAAVVKSLLAG